MRAAALLLLLAACGFSPIYDKDAPARALEGRISLPVIEGREGFAFREALETRLGVATLSDYALTASMEVEREGLAISTESAITRYRVEGVVTFALRRSGDSGEAESLLEGVERAYTAYSTTASPFATRIAERDARDRLARALAGKVADRIELAADRLAP